MKTRHLLLAAALLLAATAAKASPGIGWQNSPFDTALLDSSGNLLDASYTFALGTFGNSFTPTAANTSLWGTNWKLLDSATAPVDPVTGHGWNVADQIFASSFAFNANGTVQGHPSSPTFVTGEQAYLWVYNAAGQWALVTDDVAGAGPDDIWKLPDPSNALGGQLTWVLDNATNAVLGNLNGNFNGTDFRMQTVQVATVPEPSGALMILLVGCLTRYVRSRQRC